MIKYSFATGQYIDENGRFVSRENVIAFVDDQQASLKRALINNARKYNSGVLSLQEWQKQHIELTKLASVRMTLLGGGGKKMVTSQHYGVMGANLKPEWKALDNFAQEIAAGKLSKKQIEHRAGMYAQSASKSFYKSEFLTKSKEGFNQAKRVLDPQAKHCDECVNYQSLNWKNITEIIPPGTNCSCRGNCRCNIIFKKDYRTNLINNQKLIKVA